MYVEINFQIRKSSKYLVVFKFNIFKGTGNSSGNKENNLIRLLLKIEDIIYLKCHIRL